VLSSSLRLFEGVVIWPLEGAPSVNNKVAASARYARSRVHGAERRAGNFMNVN